MRARITVAILVLASPLGACTREQAVVLPVQEPVQSGAPSAGPAPPRAIAPDADATPGSKSGLALSGDGLALIDIGTGSIQHVPFGTATALVIAAVTQTGGEPRERFENPECGAGPLDSAIWDDGLHLQFQGGRFVGWSVNQRAAADSATPRRLATIAGIGLGSSRTALSAAYTPHVFESTLGTEFSAGPLNGLFESPAADAKITALWAGTTCIFR